MYDKLMQWKAMLLETVWPEDIEASPGWKQLLIRGMQISYALVRDMLDGQLTLRAMSLVYTTLLSMVPLLALTFSVLKGFGVHNQLEPMLLNALAALGDKGVEVTEKIVGFVENIKVGVLGALGLGMLVYTVISLLHKIEKSFNYTWHITQSRPIGQRFSEYLSVVLVGPLLIFSALGITGTMMSSTIVQFLTTIPVLGMIVASIGKLIPYALVIAAFTFVYVFMPNTKVRLGPALIGGLVAGVMWETMGWAFGAFVVSSSNYTAVYSGFAILIMFMIWLFVSWLILLLGASIAFYCQHPEHLGLQRGRLHLSPQTLEKLSLLVMHFIGQRYYRHDSGWKLEDLSHWLGVPSNVAEVVLDKLHECSLILHTSEASSPYVPAQDMERLQVRQVLEAVRKGNEGTGLTPWRLASEPAVDRLIEGIRNGMDTAMGDKTLKDMVLSDLTGKCAKGEKSDSVTQVHFSEQP
ncbi:MAG: YihY/virulence factor BrkB family protein [Mariprofundaceae bacterium]